MGPRYLQVLVQVQFGEVVLEMDSEVHVLHRVNHNVNKLHAGHLPTVNTATNARGYSPALWSSCNIYVIYNIYVLKSGFINLKIKLHLNIAFEL